MDEISRKIYKELRRNGRVKLTEIARKLVVPVSTVHKKMRELLRSGEVEVKAVPNLERLGYGIKAFVLIKIDTSSRQIKQEELAKKIAGMKNVIEASVITGGWDIIVKVACRSIKELKHVVLEKLRGMEGVAGTETLVVLHEEKSSLVWV